MNILVFCSNPVDGGTAKVFYELVCYLKKKEGKRDRIFACVNKNNPVEIYGKIDFLDRLDVYSEQEVFKNLYGGILPIKIVKKIMRMFQYSPIKKQNINKMKNYIIENKIDCIFIHNGGYVGDDLCNQILEAAYACAKQTVCRVYVLHNDFKKNIFTKLRFKSYDKKISKEATELVTVSNFTKNRILSNSYITRKMTVIYNGLPESSSLSSEEKKGKIHLDTSKYNILMLGNFQENKGQLQFIEAAKLMKQKNECIEFTFIGNVYDRTYYKQCIENIKKYKLENCTKILHGINNAAEYMDMFDVIAVPSMYDESFGLISVEAMSKAVPVVAFACGGIPEVLIDGTDGYIVPVGDSTCMAGKILELLNNEKLKNQMGQNGRADYIKRFSVDAMGAQYFALVGKYRR